MCNGYAKWSNADYLKTRKSSCFPGEEYLSKLVAVTVAIDSVPTLKVEIVVGERWCVNFGGYFVFSLDRRMIIGGDV